VVLTATETETVDGDGDGNGNGNGNGNGLSRRFVLLLVLHEEEQPVKYAGQRIRVVAAEIVRDGRYLITQRPPKAVLPLLWEFPGGRVEGEETDEQALQREIDEKFGVTPTVRDLTLEVTHDYPEYTVNLRVYRCAVPPGEFAETHVYAYRWVAPDEFDRYEFPGADQATIDMLVRSL